ncbi:hypothetical protein GPECTOR_184g269 [Gonium pectorale]|uniref:Ankyrin repeat domain-containing protein n=1 Tax=Gonium pectorale TaxID=33097 RepID=A0A150FYS1_GONPE|nr:hypothetical protein GPECTOR_184g269 [Gonium pectorale]|eukprot:KXZ42200.1 hypothetical protein GPECTOR_184g269 [Gonium pectorale]
MAVNDVAASFRQVNKATAERLVGPQHTVIRLSQPVPPHAFAAHWLAPGATRGLTLQRRKQLLSLTAASGVLPNLEVALQAAGLVGGVAEAFGAAAGAGQLSTCQWLRDYSRDTEDLRDACRVGNALVAAASGGQQHVCEWLLAINRNAPKDRAVIAAVCGGHANLAEWLLLQQGPITPISATSAQFLLIGVAHGCDLAALQRAWLRFGPDLSPDQKADVLSSAAGSPTPDWAAKVEWLEAHGAPRNEHAAAEAAALPGVDGGVLARLALLRGRGYPIDDVAVTCAACGGNAPALQYLLAVVPAGIIDYAAAARNAAHGGHLASLQALHAAGWHVHPDQPTLLEASAVWAARGGHLHVLAWLEEVQLLPLHSGVSNAAAGSGSVEVLAWLAARGCLTDYHAYSEAVYAGCEAALEWLVEQGCPMEDRGYPYVNACSNGDMAMARCLRRLGVPWGSEGRVFYAAAVAAAEESIDPLPLLRWMLQEGCPVDVVAVRRKVEERRCKMPQWAEQVLGLLEEHGGRRQA